MPDFDQAKQANYTLLNLPKMEKNVKIKELIRETEDAITVVFEKDEQISRYIPGQFLNVYQTIGEEVVSRAYSFTSAPETGEHPAVTIKRVPGGKMSGFLIDSLREAESLLVSGPLGRFGIGTLPESGHLVFIAGGSGITPLFSMIKSVLATSPSLTVTLLYGSRSYESIIFRRQLEVLEATHPGQLKVIHFLSAGSHDLPADCYVSGRISTERIKDFVVENQQVEAFYICGPDQMMNSITQCLDALGIRPDRIRKESYGSSGVDFRSGSTDDYSEITFWKADQKIIVRQPRNKFILQAALEQEVKLPHSCKEGMCGSCMVKVLSGKVTITENYALTDKQLAEGLTLLCTGLPESGEVEVLYL